MLPELFAHGLAQLLVGHVQVPLRGLEVGVAEEELNRAQIQPLREPAAGGLVPQVVPVQIDLCELLAIDAAVRSRARGFDAVGQ